MIHNSKIHPINVLPLLTLGSALTLACAGLSHAQAIPGLPTAPAAPAKDDSKTDVSAPTKDNPEATVAEAAGPIDVNKPVNEFKAQDFIEETLAKYPGVYEVHAAVNGSVVTLTGHVENDEVRDMANRVALKVQGIVFVANQLKTDAQVLSARELLKKRLSQYGGAIAQNWLLFVLSIGFVVIALLTARLFSTFGDLLLTPFTANSMLRSVLASLLSAAIFVIGLLAALQVFGIASAVMSVLGLAGVVALAIGFAFRDITENFIASILLSTRRPFQVGDYIEVASQAGVVKALNTRATVLVTLEGKTVRIPNSTVYKEIVSNASASTSARSTFDVLIPYDVSTVQAMDLIGSALSEHDAILKDPPPRALGEELNPIGVKLRVYFWMPTHGVDGFKVNSDAKLNAKVALQKAGIRPPASPVSLTVAARVPVDLSEPTHGDPHRTPARPTGQITEAQARANLAEDSRGAQAAADEKPKDEAMQHVLRMSAGDAVSEGENLLARPENLDGNPPNPQPAANGTPDGASTG
jgi:small-conductance mechanosensitive channel